MSNKEGYKDPTAEKAIENVMKQQERLEMLTHKKEVSNGTVKTEKSNKN